MLYRLRSNAFEVFVPHAVLGEICVVIFRDFERGRDRRGKMGMLVDVMGSNKIPWKNMRPASKDAFDIVAALVKDEWLDTTDALILSQVLADPDSVLLHHRPNHAQKRGGYRSGEGLARRRETARGPQNIRRFVKLAAGQDRRPVRREP